MGFETREVDILSTNHNRWMSGLVSKDASRGFLQTLELREGSLTALPSMLSHSRSPVELEDRRLLVTFPSFMMGLALTP